MPPGLLFGGGLVGLEYVSFSCAHHRLVHTPATHRQSDILRTKNGQKKRTGTGRKADRNRTVQWFTRLSSHPYWYS